VLARGAAAAAACGACVADADRWVAVAPPAVLPSMAAVAAVA